MTIRRLLITALLTISAFALATTSASARVLWTADAERPTYREWANNSCEDDTRVKQVAAPAAQGRRAYKFEVRDGDDSYGERCELGEGNPTRDGFPLFEEGDERWISFQVRLPDDYPINSETWNVIMQLKQLGGIGTPAVSMEVQRGKWALLNSDTNRESSGCNWWWTGPAKRNQWTKFSLHVKFSPDRRVGWIELYGDLDGQGMKRLMERTNMHTMKIENGRTVKSHSRIGLYRNPKISGTSHLLFDGYTIGTDRSSVESNAFGANPTASGPQKAEPRRDSSPRKKSRVWLRLASGGGLSAASSRNPWGRVLQVYGGVRGKKAKRRARSVIIEIKRAGRWQWLTRGWIRRGGRFYLSPAVDMGSAKVVKLRAYIPGLGRSRTLRTRLR